MYSRKFLRHILFPVSCSATVVYAKGKDDEKDGNKVRPSDLPLYAKDVDAKVVPCASNFDDESSYSIIEETIGCARQEVQILISQAKVVATQLQETYAQASEKTESTLEYLRAEDNILPRYGAIALGGTAGYVLGLRRGLFRRLLYSGTGAAAMAALCYPREAKELSEDAIIMAKKYFVIGYHFINGVCGDVFGVQLPALPMGHLVISDKVHSPSKEVVPTSAHLLPPVATPTHIPLPNEDPHNFEIKRGPKTKD